MTAFKLLGAGVIHVLLSFVVLTNCSEGVRAVLPDLLELVKTVPAFVGSFIFIELLSSLANVVRLSVALRAEDPVTVVAPNSKRGHVLCSLLGDNLSLFVLLLVID